MWLTDLFSKVVNGESESDARARGEAAERELAELNRQRAERMRLEEGEAAADAYQAAVADNYARQQQSDSQTVVNEFEEGLKEGRDNISSTIKGGFNVVGQGVAGVIGGIPWWLWLAVAGVVFGYFGGFRWLKGKVNS